MKTVELKASLRKKLGKKDTRDLRKKGLVPCVLYGGKETMHFYAHENEFRNLIYSNHVYVADIDIEGIRKQAIVKEIQFHPVTDKINHIDFLEVWPDKVAVIELPVEITGNSVGIRAGGRLKQRKRYLKVRGLIKNMPETLIIDITNLDIGDSILAGSLQFENLEIMEPGYTMVVGVVSSRAVAMAGEETEASKSGAAETPQPAASEGKPEGKSEGKKD